MFHESYKIQDNIKMQRAAICQHTVFRRRQPEQGSSKRQGARPSEQKGGEGERESKRNGIIGPQRGRVLYCVVCALHEAAGLQYIGQQRVQLFGGGDIDGRRGQEKERA